MEQDKTPKPISELLAALADDELCLKANPDALSQIGQDPQAAQRVACQKQLRKACAKAMDQPTMRCPDALAAKLRAIAMQDSARSASASPYVGPAVVGRIGRWMPAAVAAVLLLTSLVMFMQSGGSVGGTTGSSLASLMTVGTVGQFDSRHRECADKPELLHDHEVFGNSAEFDRLPGKIGNYFHTSADGVRLSLDEIGYDYQLTGACTLPGNKAVHILYRHRADPSHAISLWLTADDGSFGKLEPDRVYVEAGKTLDHPVIIWRNAGMIYYLVGDSLEDAHEAVAVLQRPV